MRSAAPPKDVRPADLDDVDRRILSLLHADARISNSALADAVGIAASTCHGRVRRLQDLGVIRGFYTDIDPAAIGLSMQAMISVSLQSNARGRIRNFIQHIRRKPQVMDVYFLAGADDSGDDPGPDNVLGVDELHIVFTEFKSMLSQTAEARRIAPMVVEYVEEDTGPHTLFSFEPDATTLFESLLPRYVATRIFAALLEAGASESASRRRAMKAASDNADDLIKVLTLMANRERQAQITQEISEIVGGANALADAK